MKKFLPTLTILMALTLSGCASMHERRVDRILSFVEATEAMPLQSWDPEMDCSEELVADRRHQFSVNEDTARYSLPNDADAIAVCFRLPPNAVRVNLRTLARGGLTYHSVHTLYPSVMVLDNAGVVIRDVAEPPMSYSERMSSSGLDGFITMDPRRAHWLVLYFRPEYFADQVRFQKSGLSAGTTGSGVFFVPYDLGFDIPVSPFGAMDIRVSVN